MLLFLAFCVPLFWTGAELRVASNLPRKSGKAPPKRLTSHQREVMQRLIERHGDDAKVRPGGRDGHDMTVCGDVPPLSSFTPAHVTHSTCAATVK